jgi:hypothetical protein
MKSNFTQRTETGGHDLWRRAVRALLVLSLVLAGAGAARPVTHAFWHPEIAPAGPLVIVVSLDEQQVYVYRNGVAIGVSPISSGKPGYETPTGVYTILQKEREHYSNLYDDAPMPYMQRLTWGGVALHAGHLPGHAASHGCIRLPRKFASELYTATRPGDVVVVADAKVAPSSIVHPAAVAPVDLAGQPMALPQGSGEHAFPAADTVTAGQPLSVIISTADRTAYVLRNGHLVAKAPVDVSPDVDVHGILLYVMENDPRAQGDGAQVLQHHWSGFRIRGKGPVPGPAVLARQIHLSRAFGENLRAAMRPGTTVLVTDLPGYGRSPDPSYGALLESVTPSASKAN